MVTVSLPTTRAPAAATAASTLTGTAAAAGTYSDSRTREREVPDALAGRREFLNYCLSLMRAHNGEHSDTLPVIDVSSLRHIAYVFDALIYYMRSGNEATPFGESGSAEDYIADLWNEQVSLIYLIYLDRQLTSYLNVLG
jgi:hypothetical protein